MNDAIASNTVRSTNNSDTIKSTTPSSAKPTMSEVLSRNCDLMTNPLRLRDPRYNMYSRDSSDVHSTAHSSSNISISSDIPGDLRQPRRSQRRRPHVNKICGVRNESKIKGAPRQRWNVFISKVSKEIDDKEIKNVLNCYK